MRPLVVVEVAEGVEGPLLGDEGRAGRANGLALESFMHPFVRAVLLGLGGEDALVLNAQAQPPDVELGEPGEPMNAGGAEGDAIAGADGARQSVFAKQAVEDGAHPVAFGRE